MSKYLILACEKEDEDGNPSGEYRISMCKESDGEEFVFARGTNPQRVLNAFQENLEQYLKDVDGDIEYSLDTANRCSKAQDWKIEEQGSLAAPERITIGLVNMLNKMSAVLT